MPYFVEREKKENECVKEQHQQGMIYVLKEAKEGMKIEKIIITRLSCIFCCNELNSTILIAN